MAAGSALFSDGKPLLSSIRSTFPPILSRIRNVVIRFIDHTILL